MLNKCYVISYGTDPEGFFQQNGRIIGSEKILPENGLKPLSYVKANVVRDGVQFELNPSAQTSVPALAANIGQAFSALRRAMMSYPDVTLSWKTVVEMEREELDSLSPKSRLLGCAPSRNVYKVKKLHVDAETYLKRSAGGHLHLGVNGTTFFDNYGGKDERGRLVPLLDLFVGMFAVLLDRDMAAVERRQVYGQAGEHRLPAHGVEYRTLSNFWLQNYSLMSLVYGMADLAISVLNTSEGGGADVEQELVDVIDIKKVIKSIQNNDYKLARKNIDLLRPFFAKHVPVDVFQLSSGNLDKFLRFTEVVNKKGLDDIFPEDRLTHWAGGRFEEFYTFLEKLEV